MAADGMATTDFIMRIKKITPTPIKLLKAYMMHILLPKEKRVRDRELGIFFLEQAKAFSRLIDGRPEAFDSVLKTFIMRKKYHKQIKQMNKVHQYLQTVFMGKYEKNLYDFYHGQEYLILLTFLSYPFRGPFSLSSHIDPFVVGSRKIEKMRILDYGAGLAFGIVSLLRRCPDSIESITIVDLDLVHTQLVEYIISTVAPGKKVKINRLRQTDQVPAFGDQKFNFMFGLDVFEHLPQPELLLHSMLQSAEERCTCYFDFTDHGERELQHITPKLLSLEGKMIEHGFKPTGKVRQLTEYTR